MGDRMGPGAYNTIKPFGSDAKGFTMKKKTDYSIISQTPAPGQYNVSAADNQTKFKTKAAVIPQKTSNVRASYRLDDRKPSPGEYNVAKPFGSDAKGFTIGTKKEKTIEVSPGPGDYNKDRSESLTKHRSRDVSFGKESRGKEDAQAQDRAAPGQYVSERFYQWGKELPIFSMGQKREEIVDMTTPGPGSYAKESPQTMSRVKGTPSMGKVANHNYSPVKSASQMSGKSGKKPRASKNSGVSRF